MVKLLTFLVELWNRRYEVLLPIVLLPLAGLTFSLMQEATRTFTTTLNVDRQNANSPLLQNMSSSENEAILSRILKSKPVLKDSLVATGLLLDGAPEAEANKRAHLMAKRLELNVLTDDLMRITHTSPVQDRPGRPALSDTKQAELLAMVADNFVEEILAPERMRTEHLLASLAEQVKYYSEQQQLASATLDRVQQTANRSDNRDRLTKIVSLEFELQRAEAQRQLAQDEYNRLLAESKALTPGSRPSTLIRMIEPPTQSAATHVAARHATYMLNGLILGLLLAVVLMILRHITDTRLRGDDDIHTLLGVKIIGHLPGLGQLRITNGCLEVEPQTTPQTTKT